MLDETGAIHHAKAYDLYRLHTKLGVTSTDPKQKAQNAKLKHEVIHICKDIVEYCIQNNIAHLALEALKMAPKQHNKGKVFNKLVNNKWVRSLIVQQITKRCALAGVNLHTIHPAYSSIIGNLTYQIYDPCASAAEMARRCIEIVCSSTDKKKRYSLPPVTKKVDDLLNQWKKEANPTTYTDWKEIGAFLKNSKVRYRVPLPATAKSYRFICRKSGVVCHLIK